MLHSENKAFKGKHKVLRRKGVISDHIRPRLHVLKIKMYLGLRLEINIKIMLSISRMFTVYHITGWQVKMKRNQCEEDDTKFPRKRDKDLREVHTFTPRRYWYTLVLTETAKASSAWNVIKSTLGRKKFGSITSHFSPESLGRQKHCPVEEQDLFTDPAMSQLHAVQPGCWDVNPK